MKALTALVVDDEPGMRESFAAALRRRGMVVFESDSGLRGLTLARTARPDVLVTDIHMPGIDGVELCRQLRAEAVFRNLVIVAVSGDVAKQGPEALAAGCDVILAKPCSSAVLLATIQRLLLTHPSVTSRADSVRAAEALAAGCEVVLAKPCSSAVLLATIQRLLVTHPSVTASSDSETQSPAVADDWLGRYLAGPRHFPAKQRD